MKAMFAAMNSIYDEHERRGFFKLNTMAVLLTLAAMIRAILFLGVIAVVPALLGTLGLTSTAAGLIRYLRWPALALLGVAALAALYRFGPSRDQPQWMGELGDVIATVFWLVGSFLFSIYVSNFGSYDKTYGSLGVVVVLMMWIFLSAYSIMLGSDINAEMEHQTVKDTTIGESRPRGNGVRTSLIRWVRRGVKPSLVFRI